jgi:hypothetical protein
VDLLGWRYRVLCLLLLCVEVAPVKKYLLIYLLYMHSAAFTDQEILEPTENVMKHVG